MQPIRLAVLLILFSAASAPAQDRQCTLKLSDLPAAPELFGFRIGMTKDEVKARVPQVVFGKATKLGVSKTSINPDFDTRIDKTTFTGVRTVSLDLLDGRVTSLWFGYDSSFKWQTVPEFVEGISQSLRLPNAWRSWKSRGQQLHCADFQMTVSIVAEGPSFRILDEDSQETLTARRETEEEQTSEEESEAIVANRQSKIYYSKGCHPENEIKEPDLVTFITSEDAEKAGYKRAQQCQ